MYLMIQSKLLSVLNIKNDHSKRIQTVFTSW